MAACSAGHNLKLEEVCLDCCNEQPEFLSVALHSFEQAADNHILLQKKAAANGSVDLLITHPHTVNSFPFYAVYLALNTAEDESGNITQNTDLLEDGAYRTAVHLSGDYLANGILFIQYDNRRYCLSGVAYIIDIGALSAVKVINQQKSY